MSAPDTTFTTRDGRQWRAAFTDATERAALDALGLRLSDLAGRRPDQVTERFRDRLDLFGALLWSAVEDQATARGVTPEGFAALMTAAHFPAAVTALLRAIAARHPKSRLAAGLALADRRS